MKNNDALKKHHFWILFGVVPLFSLIGVQCVNSNVGSAIEKRQKEIEDAKKKIDSKQKAKPKSLITDADTLIDKVGKKSGVLHKDNWERQKDLFTWPNSDLLKEIEQKGYKFGDPLPKTRGQLDEFRKADVYLHEFSSRIQKNAPPGPGTGMADRVAPTQFKGGWDKVLRHVADFGQVDITSDQVWLIMEDIWVQRSLLAAVRAVNEEMAGFHRAIVNSKNDFLDDPSFDDQGNKLGGGQDRNGRPITVPTPDKEKRKALFHNRTWAIELELVTEGDSQRLTGTLTNLSERLQLMGSGNVMTLRVWFTHSPTEQPMVFKIGGEFLPGKGAMKRDKEGREVPANVLPIGEADAHTLPPGKVTTEIVRVEQVFDVRTVPIKRIDALVMGAKDSRTGDAKGLVPPNFMKDPAAPEAAATPTTGPGSTPPGPGHSLTAPGQAPPSQTAGNSSKPTGGPAGPGERPGGAQGQGPAGQPFGAGPITAVIDGNKRRYLPDGVTDQVRRMPIGIVVVVDQSYVQDVLLAFANSPLRFQITQVEWTRYRANDLATGTGGSSGPGGSQGPIAGVGQNNVVGPGDPDIGNRPGAGRRPPGRPGPGPSGPPVGITPGRPPVGPAPSPGVYGTGGASSIASESQITAGLVELSIYGVVSLYEKYTEPVPPGAPVLSTNAPGAPPTPPAPPGGTPPGPAVNPAAPPAKKRRRVRK